MQDRVKKSGMTFSHKRQVLFASTHAVQACVDILLTCELLCQSHDSKWVDASSIDTLGHNPFDQVPVILQNVRWCCVFPGNK